MQVKISNPDGGRSVRFLGLVDSGSDSCFFDAELGESIGLDVRSGRSGKIYGVVPDKWVQHFSHAVLIEIHGTTHEIEAGFVYGLSKHGYGILGQSGFFDKIAAVIFEKQKGVFEVIP